MGPLGGFKGPQPGRKPTRRMPERRLPGGPLPSSSPSFPNASTAPIMKGPYSSNLGELPALPTKSTVKALPKAPGGPELPKRYSGGFGGTTIQAGFGDTFDPASKFGPRMNGGNKTPTTAAGVFKNSEGVSPLLRPKPGMKWGRGLASAGLGLGALSQAQKTYESARYGEIGGTLMHGAFAGGLGMSAFAIQNKNTMQNVNKWAASAINANAGGPGAKGTIGTMANYVLGKVGQAAKFLGK